MKLSKKEARVVKSAISTWQDESVIDQAESERLLNSLEVTVFDWKRLAKYSFWMAIASILISLSAVLADEWLITLFEKLFTASAFAKFIACGVIAGVLYYLGLRRQQLKPQKIYSNEAFFLFGVFFTAGAVAFLGDALDTGSGHFSLLLLLASFIYGALGLWFPSKLVWIFSLLSLGSWFGAETGYMSGWGAYYLGMNFPMRFVLFGLALLIISSYAFRLWPSRAEFLAPTRIMGLLYLFISLWIMSIFGNYGDMDKWYDAKQIELFHWSLLFALASIVSIYHGLKYDDAMTRGFGITFILINLYTRFFEYFWEDTHKAIFFALLGLSFWYLGSHAEKIWHLQMLDEYRDKNQTE